MSIPDDIEHLIYEALVNLGWDSDPEAIAEKVSRLHVGLPSEDEFSILSSWLGRCSLIHKLDQKQHPANSKNEYQVPDLFAVFDYKGTKIPVLIEVKSKTKPKLSFTSDYYSKLSNYASLHQMPILVAWKLHSTWMLFDLDCMKKAEKNLNISLNDAMKNNLLGVLAGDFAYTIGEDCSFNLRFRKDELVRTVKDTDREHEEWRMTIDDVCFTDRDGNEIRKLPKEVQALFLTWDLELDEKHTKSHVYQKYRRGDTTMLFAHMALVRLLHWKSPLDSGTNWRELLGQPSSATNGLENFRESCSKAMEHGIVNHIFDQLPEKLPSYMDGK